MELEQRRAAEMCSSNSQNEIVQKNETKTNISREAATEARAETGSRRWQRGGAESWERVEGA